MANNEIKQKIVLEGEKQYRDAIKEAQRNLKTLRSELKAETAEMGRNATEQQKAEAKAKALRKEIAEQEKIVKANKAALEEVKEKYGDNAEAVAKYEQQLNNSRTALANMKNELDGLGQGFRKVSDDANIATIASKSIADTLQSLSSVGDSIASGIESAFTGMISTIKSAIGEVWTDLMEIAAKADSWTDLAAFLGTDVTTVQKWSRAMKGVGSDISVITNMITKLKYGGKEHVLAEYFGVSGVNYTDDLQFAEVVLRKMVEDKNKMVADGTWANAMSEIFGAKKVQEIDSILSDWEEIQRGLNEFDVDKGGIGLSSDELKTMNDLFVQVGLLQEKWNAFKESVEAKIFGGIALELTGNAQTILDSLIKYFNTEDPQERQNALEEIEANILAMFETVEKAIRDGIELLNQMAEDLKESDNPTAKVLGNLLGGIAEALQWLTEDHMMNVVRAFELLAGFWAGAKAVQLIAKLAEFAMVISTLSLSRGLNAAAAGAAAGSSWGSAFAAAVLKAAPWLIGLYELLKPSSTASDELDSLWDANGNPTKAALDAGITWTMDEDKQMGEDLKKEREKQKSWREGLTEGTAGIGPGTEAQMQAAQAFWDAYRQDPFDVDSWSDAWDTFEEAYAGQEELFDKINDLINYMEQTGDKGVYDIEDLPASWWQTQGGNAGNTDGLTGADARGMTDAVNRMPQAVQRGISNIRVIMDSNVVGRLVAGEVSRQIAEYIV